MDIYLTPSGGSKIQFPMLPEAITLGADAKFMTYSIISLGDVKLPRGQGTKEISWSGMFSGSSEEEKQPGAEVHQAGHTDQKNGRVPRQRDKMHAVMYRYLYKLQRLYFQL